MRTLTEAETNLIVQALSALAAECHVSQAISQSEGNTLLASQMLYQHETACSLANRLIDATHVTIFADTGHQSNAAHSKA